jgi:Spy/CpxP family protein refolding chaperone
MTRIVVSLVLTALIALAPPALAKGGGMHGGGHGKACPMKALPKPHLSLKAMRALDLSPEQADRIAAIQRDFQVAKADTKAQVMPLKFRIFQALEADRPDAQTVQDLFGKVFEHKQAMVGRRIRTANRIRDVLTPDQWQRYQEMRQAHGGHAKGRHGKGGKGKGHGDH